MSRINMCEFVFATPAANQVRVLIRHPALGANLLIFDDARLQAILTAPQHTQLIALLGLVFATAEADIKAQLDAARATLNTDP